MARRVGEAIMRREVWQGKPLLGTIVFVVQDTPELHAGGRAVRLPGRRLARRRTSPAACYDSQDHELDIWVPVAGDWSFKDAGPSLPEGLDVV